MDMGKQIHDFLTRSAPKNSHSVPATYIMKRPFLQRKELVKEMVLVTFQ
jgi:hypothetical protein